MRQTTQIWIFPPTLMSLIYLPVLGKQTGDGLCPLKRFGPCNALLPATCEESISANQPDHGGGKGRFPIKHTSLITDPCRLPTVFSLLPHPKLPRYHAPEDHLTPQTS